MPARETKEQMNKDDGDPVKRASETHSGTPNAVDPTENRSTEHKSGYGGEGGEPRTSSEKRTPKDPKRA